MRCIVVLFLLTAFAATFSDALTPNPIPKAVITYNPITQLITIQTNLSYCTDATQFTYSLDFTPWGGSSNLYTPTVCTNRKGSAGFNETSKADSWTSIFQHQSGLPLVTSAVNGFYNGWPVPSSYWSTYIVTAAQYPGSACKAALAGYTGTFTIDKISSCAGSTAFTVTATPTTITYSGTFYVTWLQPNTNPNPSSQPWTGTYTNIIYSFPFTIQVPRQSASAGGNQNAFNIGSINSVVQSVQVVHAPGQPTGYNKLIASVQTQTPASLLTGTTTLAWYNDLKYINIVSLGNGQPVLSLNATLSSQVCTVNSLSYCVQTWGLNTAPVQQTFLNGTYLINFIVQTCNVSHPLVCTPTSLTSTLTINLQSLQTTVTQISTVTSFTSNIYYYSNSSYTTQLTTNTFLPGTTIYSKQIASLGRIANSFYRLDLNNLWICSPVPGGYPPFLGYDVTLNMQRYGCSLPETIAGIVNIPASNIIQLVSSLSNVVNSQTTPFHFNTTHKSNQPLNHVAFSFSSDAVRNLKFPTAYVHADGLLTPATTSFIGSSAHFKTQQMPKAQSMPTTHYHGTVQNVDMGELTLDVSTNTNLQTSEPALLNSVANPNGPNNYQMAALRSLNITSPASSEINITVVAYSTSVVGGVLLIVGIIVGCYCYRKRKAERLEREKRDKLQNRVSGLELQVKRQKRQTGQNAKVATRV